MLRLNYSHTNVDNDNAGLSSNSLAATLDSVNSLNVPIIVILSINPIKVARKLF